MKKLLLIPLLFLFLNASSQSLYFPPTLGQTWDTTSLNSLGWCQNELDTLLDYLDQRNSKAFIILKDGKIVVEHYFDSFTKDSVWYWASAGKTMTSFLVGMAQEEGYLNINDTSSKYMGQGWTSAPLAKENLITVRHQLEMTSGLDDGTGNADCTDDTCLHYLADAGTRWSYHNAPYTLLDSVVENATGSNLSSYMLSKLYSSTGFLGSYIKLSYNNVLFSKPRMMARFGLLCLNKGKWDNTVVMSDTNYFNDMITPRQSLNQNYGYLWWLNENTSYMLPSLQFVFTGKPLPNAPSTMYSALGKNGQILNIIPDQNLVVVRMGDNPDNSLVPTAFADTMWQHINNVMCTSTGVNTISNLSESITVYPNPANDIITISGIKAERYTIKILSIDGKEIMEINNKNQLSTKSLVKGRYILKLQTKNGVGIKHITHL